MGSPPFGELLAVLGAQASELRRLLPLLDEQQRALVRADAGAVMDLTRRQEPVIRKLVGLEAERRRVLGGLATALGAEARGLTLSRVLRLVPDAPAGLARLGDELRGLGEGLRALNARNGYLIDRSLGYLERLLGQLVTSLAPAPIYAASGRAAPAVEARRLVDRRA
jgi:flagellar biosynthesis/type III secretory pathway chaperone